MTRGERQNLRVAALRAVAGAPTTPWQLQTSNSFRRIGACGDGDVLCAVTQRSDGQPDLLAASGVLDYIVAAQPRVVLELLGALDAAEEALNQARGAARCEECGRDLAPTWTLVNVEERATEHPSFKIPSHAERDDLHVGDFAKLVFVDPAEDGVPSGERMWVKIMAVEAGCYRGRLRDVPVLIQNLKEGDPIEFGSEHVAGWVEVDRDGGDEC